MLQAAGSDTVPMHLAVIATRLTPGQSQTVIAAERFVIPGGNCILQEAVAGSNATCRFPFEHETPVTVTGNVTNGECDAAATHPATAQLRTMAAGTRADPMVQVPLRMGGSICSGTQLTFTPFREDGKIRMEVDAAPADLESFRDQ
ncbi:hypothetical protein [Terriglobus roseus]|uniref:Uncharacterized protein n=1 Tax=Terriglobus roseus TaxID=392734 RepID=A0A1H4KHG8_9BACT|nr:hypothetical protein [Terriglobus roseus]SEB58004.1 hypothetical protein SAMN05443244_1203 [Terriglobus roseus]